MTYEEFGTVLKAELEIVYGETATVVCRTFTGNNGEKKDALCIHLRGKGAAPVIYLRSLYESFLGGQQIVDILAMLVRFIRNSEGSDISSDLVDSWDKVRDHIGAKLISAEANRELLADVPHRIFMDLALVYYLYVDTPEIPSGSAVIHNVSLEIWGIREEDLYRESRRNLPRLFPACIYEMEEMLTEMLTAGRVPAKNLLEDAGEERPGALYVVTNSERYFGALSMFYDGVLDRFLEMKGWSEVYAIPSSIHEMILAPGETVDEESLLTMVREVNDTSVEPEERLTYSVYRYDRKANSIRRISSAGTPAGSLFGIRVE